MRRKNTNNAAGAGKSMKMGTDELKDLIKSAVKEVMDGTEEGTAADEPLEDVTAGDIADVIEQAFAAADEKRKSRKDAGEEVGDLTAEEVIAEAEAILENMADAAEEGMSDEEADAEGKADDEDGEEKEDGDAGDESAKRRKSAAASRQAKSNAQLRPAQRKYAGLFMGGSAGGTARQEKKIPPMVQLARAIKCLDVFGRNDPERAAYAAKKHYNDQSMAREFKALSVANPATGGFLIPEVYLDEVIELLYNKTVIKELGARTIPLETGNLNIPRMTSGTRATWGGEARKIKTTQPTFGNLRLSAKRLEAIVPMTRELLMSTKYSADEMFGNDLARRMQLGLDWGGLYGKGGEFQPTGIANTPRRRGRRRCEAGRTVCRRHRQTDRGFPGLCEEPAHEQERGRPGAGLGLQQLRRGLSDEPEDRHRRLSVPRRDEPGQIPGHPVCDHQPDPHRCQGRHHRHLLRQLGRPDDRRPDGPGDLHHHGGLLDGRAGRAAQCL